MELPDGTLMWGEVGPGRTNGWMHILSSGYEDEETQPFIDLNPFSRHYLHRTAWAEWAGFRLFGSRFTFWVPHLPTGTPRHRHTFDIVFENRIRPWALERFEGVIFGDVSYDDGEFFLLERRQGPVLAVNRRTEQPVFEWRHLDICLKSNLERFSIGFDDCGETITGSLSSGFS
jgi:hypothetical protein